MNKLISGFSSLGEDKKEILCTLVVKKDVEIEDGSSLEFKEEDFRKWATFLKLTAVIQFENDKYPTRFTDGVSHWEQDEIEQFPITLKKLDVKLLCEVMGLDSGLGVIGFEIDADTIIPYIDYDLLQLQPIIIDTFYDKMSEYFFNKGVVVTTHQNKEKTSCKAKIHFTDNRKRIWINKDFKEKYGSFEVLIVAYRKIFSEKNKY